MGLGKTIQVLALLLVQRHAEPADAAAALPAGGAGLAAGQLGGGDRALRPRSAGADRASLGDDGRGVQGSSRRTTPPSSIWRSPATARCCACRRSARSRGGWSSSTRRRRSRTRTPSRPGGQGAEGAGADRADRHAGREQPRRPVVDLRLHQSRAARNGRSSSPATPKALAERTDNPYGPLRELVRPYILRRHEDRPIGHRRPARQDRGEGAIAISAASRRRSMRRRSRTGPAAWRRPTASSARASCWRC